MKVDPKTSRDIIDRRRVAGFAFLTGILALLAVVFGRGSAAPDPEIELVHVVSTALDRGQHYWEPRIPGYQHAKVVLFRGSTSTPCGRGLAVSGPFYCPRNSHVYIDLSFVASIQNNLARSFVVAHELGHHVQNTRHELDGRPSIDVELEADCLAAIWMAAEEHAGRLDTGDIAAALAEASSIGDDRLCPQCAVETFQHGSSDQRLTAVRTGLERLNCNPYR